MHSPDQRETYEAIPFRMVCPAVPALSLSEPSGSAGQFLSNGLRSLSGCPEVAQERAGKLLRHAKWRAQRGDRDAVRELLAFNPAFAVDPWVRQELLRVTMTGRSVRSRGRPKDSGMLHPLLVVGLIEELIASGRAKNREQAFARLGEVVRMNYATAKRVFYEALSDRRFRPILMTFPELGQRISNQDMAEIAARAQIPAPGDRVTRTLAHTRDGPVTATFEFE